MTRGARGSTLVSETLLLFLSLRAGPNRRKIFFREYPATAARRNYDMISTAPFPWDRGNWECGRSAIHQLDGLTDKQQNQIEDIVRLIPAEERSAFLEMLAHELRGRELTAGELRLVAERTWRTFLQHGSPIRGPEDAA